MKLSVIVPVYNVEKYIDKCLKSLISQNIKDFEIIVVNDGSTDKSQSIIDKYVKKYPKLIKSYIKQNTGVSDTRNYGIAKSTGDYVTFLDSDDYVENNIYEIMLKKAKENNFDMVVCDLYYEYENGAKKIVKSRVKKDIYTEKEIKKAMLNIYTSVWNKIYKKSLLKNVEFKKNVWYEDVEFIYRLIPKVKSIGVVKEPLINYVQREGSITKTYDKRLYDEIYNWNGLIEYYKKKDLYKSYKKEIEYCYIRYIYASFISQALNYKSYSDYKKAVNYAIENVKKQFPKYRVNKYFYINGIKGYYLLIFNNYIAILMYKAKKRKK